MNEISESAEEKGSFKISHLGVDRGVEKSWSTAVRSVFSTPYLTTKVNSLKSIQYKGGIIQDTLISIIVIFKKYIFDLFADI